MFRKLDPDRIVDTLLQLERRIEERFPGAGLAKVCAELTEIARQTRTRSEEIGRPVRWLRALVLALLVLGALLLLILALGLFGTTTASNELFGTLQGIDAGFNILVLMGAALFFLSSIEERVKRKRALGALHELRSIIHVIDMHQLTKDPSAASLSTPPTTASSPKRNLTPFELTRYLDYCSEMLSLTAKVAALYAQSFPDPIVTEAVNDLERTSTSLSQKIWQKITLVQSVYLPAAATAGPATAIAS